jgi:hypothetical protein
MLPLAHNFRQNLLRFDTVLYNVIYVLQLLSWKAQEKCGASTAPWCSRLRLDGGRGF